MKNNLPYEVYSRKIEDLLPPVGGGKGKNGGSLPDTTKADGAELEKYTDLSELWDEDDFTWSLISGVINSIKDWGSIPGEFAEKLVASTKSRIYWYFQRVSSLDTKLMESASACNDNCHNTILQNLSEEIIPTYYEDNYRNDTKFGRGEIEYEAKQRNFKYDVIEETNGEDGNEKCEINISIYGERFVVQTDQWKNFFWMWYLEIVIT